MTTVSSHSDGATGNLLDLKDDVKVLVKSNGKTGEDQPDNRRSSESDNNPSSVRSSLTASACFCFMG